jgi:carbon storage regulator
MLVLSRKEAQRIRVGDSIIVTVVKIAGDKVRVGIEAPSDVLVLRDELEAWDVAPGAALARSEGRCEGRCNGSCAGRVAAEAAPVAVGISAGLKQSA